VTRGLFGPGPIVLGGGAVVLVAFLIVGWLLPASWEAGADVVVPVPPGVIMPFLDAPEGWQSWTPWPDSTSRTGPERGAGAMIRWDDRELGSGAFRIEDVGALEVAYTVTVEGAGGSVMETHGSVRLSVAEEGTRIEWREAGDLGRNPLMGYWALTMDRAQSLEMQKGLDRLAVRSREAAEALSTPRDSTNVSDVRPDSARSR
jgi:carbon monoxide dehydrogenase subunit G